VVGSLVSDSPTLVTGCSVDMHTPTQISSGLSPARLANPAFGARTVAIMATVVLVVISRMKV